MTRAVSCVLDKIRRRSVACAVVACAVAGPVRSAAGADADITVLTRDGAAVVDVAVVLDPVGVAARPGRRETIRMDQRARRFVPQVVVVETGGSVDFPNSDQVSHQVYSFSPARHFQLPLYKGATHPPVTFPKPGLVVLGCNIHDEMVGYVLVTDSPFHGTTDERGAVRIRDLPPGPYKVTVWGPLIHDGGGTLTASLTIGADGTSPLTLRLKDPLRRTPTPRPGRVDWDGY